MTTAATDPTEVMSLLSSRTLVTPTCWMWQGGITDCGYGRVWIDGRSHPAHRVAYSLKFGEVPEDMVVDHVCRVRSCVNPDHLRVLTNVENVMIGISPAAINARKTHCARGHAFTPENTYLRKGGRRRCRTCQSEYDRAKDLRRQQQTWTCEVCGVERAANTKRSHLQSKSHLALLLAGGGAR